MTPPRRLGFFDLLALGINGIVGAGIYYQPEKMAGVAGIWSLAAFPLCALLLCSVALCYAELASLFRRNGAAYLYAQKAFGPAAGFGAGWLAWVTALFSWAAVAGFVALQLGQFWPGLAQPLPRVAVAVTMILFFGGLNYVGVRPGAWAVNVFTVAKLLPLLLLVAVGLPGMGGLAEAAKSPSAVPAALGGAVFLALFPLQGFEVTPVVAGESRSARRNVPAATVISLLVAGALYTLIQAVYLSVSSRLPAPSGKPLADAAAALIGPGAAGLVAVSAAISMAGFNAGVALGCPRFLSALAEDNHLPAGIGRVHPRFLTPDRAILCTALLAAAAAALLPLDRLVNLSNITVVTQYAVTCLALLVLRARKPRLHRAFRLPGGKWIAGLGFLVAVGLATQVGREEILAAAGTVAAGYLLRFFWLSSRARFLSDPTAP